MSKTTHSSSAVRMSAVPKYSLYEVALTCHRTIISTPGATGAAEINGAAGFSWRGGPPLTRREPASVLERCASMCSRRSCRTYISKRFSGKRVSATTFQEAKSQAVLFRTTFDYRQQWRY